MDMKEKWMGQGSCQVLGIQVNVLRVIQVPRGSSGLRQN